MSKLERIPHVVWAIFALALVLAADIVLVILHGAQPKLMDGVLLLIGAVAGLSRGDVPPGSSD